MYDFSQIRKDTLHTGSNPVIHTLKFKFKIKKL